jgi:NAD(P)-dependent dehydrogenase (short-subunit alcohol dehydrogenase family)
VLQDKMQGKLADVTPLMLRDTFATNTFGPFIVTQELLKHVSGMQALARGIAAAARVFQEAGGVPRQTRGLCISCAGCLWLLHTRPTTLACVTPVRTPAV